MNLDISDLDRYVLDCTTAAEMAGLHAVYVGHLCKMGVFRARKALTQMRHVVEEDRRRPGSRVVRRRPGGRPQWTDIDLLDVVMYAAERHLRRTCTTVRPPEDILALLPARCPRCGILSDGLCTDCRQETETGHVRFYEER